jgi:hypothetical protein
MTPKPSTPDTGDARSDAELEASIQAKIDAAIATAIQNQEVDPDQQIGVVIGPDGSITVRNVAPEDLQADSPGVPDPVVFPAMYADDTRESLADSHYKDHLESHWGF